MLLAGHVSKDAGPWEAASLLGFPADADLVVVAAQTNEVAAESLPGIARRLAEQGCVSGWRLTPALQDSASCATWQALLVRARSTS